MTVVVAVVVAAFVVVAAATTTTTAAAPTTTALFLFLLFLLPGLVLPHRRFARGNWREAAGGLAGAAAVGGRRCGGVGSGAWRVAAASVGAVAVAVGVGGRLKGVLQTDGAPQRAQLSLEAEH